MKAIDKKIRQNGLRTKRYLSYSIIFFVLFGFSSCTEDYWIIESPQPSNAYIALTWSEDEPDYIDAGNGAYNDDNYFSIDLNPYGPYVDLDYKSSATNSNFNVLETSDSKIVILKQEEEYSLKVTYRKIERRNQQ